MPRSKVTKARLFLLFLWAAVSLKYLPWPWAWALLGAAALALLEARRRRGAPGSVVWWNIGLSLAVAAALEGGLSLQDSLSGEKRSPVHGTHLYDCRPDTLLGYSPIPNTRRQMTKTLSGETIYDVPCTIGSDGLRLAPPASERCDRSLLFFGCSFAFGEGVGDEETMPYGVGRRTGGRYRIYNFAVHGYGPQHMLAQIEKGRVASVVKQRPEAAFYWCLYPEHVYRLPGRRPWTRAGPKYVLDEKGRAVYAGRFEVEKPKRPVWSEIRWQIMKSAFGRRILAYTPPITPGEERLFYGVLARSREALSEAYPGIEFHVLLSGGGEEVRKALRARGFLVHPVDSLLAESGIPEERLQLHAVDTHPSALADDLIACYLTEDVLREGSFPDSLPPDGRSNGGATPRGARPRRE